MANEAKNPSAEQVMADCAGVQGRLSDIADRYVEEGRKISAVRTLVRGRLLSLGDDKVAWSHVGRSVMFTIAGAKEDATALRARHLLEVLRQDPAGLSDFIGQRWSMTSEQRADWRLHPPLQRATTLACEEPKTVGAVVAGHILCGLVPTDDPAAVDWVTTLIAHVVAVRDHIYSSAMDPGNWLHSKVFGHGALIPELLRPLLGHDIDRAPPSVAALVARTSAGTLPQDGNGDSLPPLLASHAMLRANKWLTPESRELSVPAAIAGLANVLAQSWRFQRPEALATVARIAGVLANLDFSAGVPWDDVVRRMSTRAVETIDERQASRSPLGIEGLTALISDEFVAFAPLHGLERRTSPGDLIFALALHAGLPRRWLRLSGDAGDLSGPVASIQTALLLYEGPLATEAGEPAVVATPWWAAVVDSFLGAQDVRQRLQAAGCSADDLAVLRDEPAAASTTVWQAAVDGGLLWAAHQWLRSASPPRRPQSEQVLGVAVAVAAALQSLRGVADDVNDLESIDALRAPFAEAVSATERLAQTLIMCSPETDRFFGASTPAPEA
jgi:hypothetical protein